MKQKPFIHLMNTPLHYYLFDVNTNQVVQIEPEVYYYLRSWLASTDGLERNSTPFIENALKKLERDGFLSDKKPSKMIHSESRWIEYHLNSNIEQITLQLTQRCNFRCNYCLYTQGENSQQRSHADKRMSLDMAKKVIDFFVSHSSNQERVAVGLYGGEPLLEFDLFKEVVRYCEQEFEGKEIVFTTTTNGSMITEDVAVFLTDHNVNLMISLDGPQAIHDRSRKYAKDGSGTYQDIIDNIKMLKQRFPELYKRISINVVVDPRYDCKDLHETFNDDLFRGLMIRSSIVDDYSSIEHVVASNEYSVHDNVFMFKALMSRLGKYPNDRISVVARNSISNRISRIQYDMSNHQTMLGDQVSHSGPCIPGQKRLFVNVDGVFYPCERVSETSEAMQIGSVDKGFDYNKARSLINICQLTESDCMSCWALQHCSLCAKYCDDHGELSPALKRSNCARVRAEAENKLKEYVFFYDLGLLEGQQ